MKRIKYGSIKQLVFASAILFSGCAYHYPTPSEAVSGIKVEAGAPNCVGCVSIKEYSTPIFASEMSALLDETGIRTGGHLSVRAAIGATNRSAGLSGARNYNQLADDARYAVSLTGKGHLFEGEQFSDPAHPYRFFVRVNHNSKPANYGAYLVNGDQMQAIVPIRFEGARYESNCFASGCVWDTDYGVSSEVVYKAIKEKHDLVMFFGWRLTRAAKSKDGFNPSSQPWDSGTTLRIPYAYLSAFLDRVYADLK